MRGIWPGGLLLAVLGCARPNGSVSPPHPAIPVTGALSKPQTKAIDRAPSHLKGAYPDPYVYIPRRSNIKLTFPVVKEFTVSELTSFGENDKVGTKLFDGYDGLEVKVIRGMSQDEVRDSIGLDIAHAKSRGAAKNGARFGFTVRRGKRGDEIWRGEDPPKGYAEMDIVQPDFSGKGFLYIGIRYRGDVDTATLRNWMVNVVNGYKIERIK